MEAGVVSLNDSFYHYIYDFYGPSAKWFAVWIASLCTFIIVSDGFFIAITLTNRSLRHSHCNWFLVGFSLSNLLVGLAHMTDVYALSTGTTENRQPCALAGILVLSTSQCSFGFPAMIAAKRFYKISAIPGQDGKWAVSRTLFHDKMAIPLMATWYLLSAASNLPLFITQGFGEDPSGFCGAVKFKSILMLGIYEVTIVSAFVFSTLLTLIYYIRLEKWLRLNSRTTRKDSMEYTRAIMLVMKLETILPMFTSTPVVILSSGQMLLPEIPMWINRALVAPFWLSYCANPWLTMLLIRPYRKRLERIRDHLLHSLNQRLRRMGFPCISDVRSLRNSTTQPGSMRSTQPSMVRAGVGSGDRRSRLPFERTSMAPTSTVGRPWLNSI